MQKNEQKCSIGEGQYDDGYSSTKLMWGEKPAFMVKEVLSYFKDKKYAKALDLGCGEGKNAYYLSKNNINVTAIDISETAISKAKKTWPKQTNIKWEIMDIRSVNYEPESFDIIVMTGPLHCLKTKDEVIKVIEKSKYMTKYGGYNVLSVFNDGEHDFSGHSDEFKPLLLPHDFYINAYKDWDILNEANSRLIDIHPHNQIQHYHSLTRILARRLG